MKIICIGLNYIDHAKELNMKLPEKPMVFMKPETSLLTDNNPFPYPDFSNEIHYETELVIKISEKCKNVNIENAHKYYNEITLGFDFTARDLQREALQKCLPWEITKGFDNSAAVGKFIEIKKLKNKDNIHFTLSCNGTQKQNGNSANMIFDFNRIISYISGFFTLNPGDLIFTGTPKGVGEVKKGDFLEAFLEDEKMLECEIV